MLPDIALHPRVEHTAGRQPRAQPAADLRGGHVHARGIHERHLRALLTPVGGRLARLRVVLPRAHAHQKAAQRDHRVDLPPRGQQQQRIRADEVGKARVRHAPVQRAQRIHRVDDALPVDLLAGDGHARLARDGQTGHLVARLRTRQLRTLVRRMARGQENDLVHISAGKGLARQMHVRQMDGIEAAAHQTDSPHAPRPPSELNVHNNRLYQTPARRVKRERDTF